MKSCDLINPNICFEALSLIWSHVSNLAVFMTTFAKTCEGCINGTDTSSSIESKESSLQPSIIASAPWSISTSITSKISSRDFPYVYPAFIPCSP